MIYFLPFISAFIGWVTNFLAIKMLFHPRQPIHILGIRIQGLFPKRQGQFAERMGQNIADNLLNTKDIFENLDGEKVKTKTREIIEKQIDHFIQNRLNTEIPMLSMFIGDKMKDKIKELLLKEFENASPEIISGIAQVIRDETDIQQLVSQKIKSLPAEEIEKQLFDLMRQEFRMIEILGAVLGFLIGLIQILLLNVF